MNEMPETRLDAGGLKNRLPFLGPGQERTRHEVGHLIRVGEGFQIGKDFLRGKAAGLRALLFARNRDGGFEVGKRKRKRAQRKPFLNAEGSMSKYKASEVCVWATERAIQIAGGIGYVRDAPLERWHRDSKIYTIFEGTSEIQQLVIARSISGMHLQ